MAENPFIGAWALVSYEFRDGQGEAIYPFGREPQGYILYTAEGLMSVAFMPQGRANFQAADLRGGTAAEKAGAYDSFFAYSGRYEIRGEVVVHHAEISLFPNWSNSGQERFYQFEGERLILSSAPVAYEGVQRTARLVWQRVQSGE